MKDADLQSLSEGLTGLVNDLQNPMTQAEKGAVLGNLVRLNAVVSNEEKRIDENEFRNEQFALNKDHTYFQEKMEENKLKEQIKENSEKNAFEQKKFEYQVKMDSKKNSLEKKKLEQQILDEDRKNSIEMLRLELEKNRLDAQRKDLEQKAKDARDDKMFKWITFGITTATSLVTTIVPILVYRKLAYTNLKLIYKDEGRPTTEYKDAIKSVQNLIRKK